MFNKKTIIIIILTVIIFFSSAALVFFLVKRAGNKAMVDSANSNIIDELKSNNPGLNSAQLKFHADAAVKGSMAPCLGRIDEGDCVASVAFIKGDRNFCHELEHENEELYKNCAGAVLKKKASAEVVQCEPLAGDDYYNCLWAVFDIYSENNDCAGLSDLGMRAICEDFFNYQTVYAKYDRKLCRTIKTEKLNQYCLKNIIEKK